MNQMNLSSDIAGLVKDMSELPEFRNTAYKNSFEGFMAKINLINCLNEVQKYKIVFIGEPGKGKTTAICNWLNLLKKEKTKEKRIDAVSLLATASGRTTVAEVHIRQVAESSCLRIEYMSVKQQIEYIREFCKYYYSRCFGINDEETSVEDNISETMNVHLEIDRVIRNMAEIENFSDKNPEKKSKIIEFMKNFCDVESFYQYVVNKVELDNRMCSKIVYDGKVPFEDWLSITFKEINDGKRKDCSIASKIYVDINSNDLCIDVPEFVDEIIDTVGLDSSVRTDLQELMQAENTICFLMDDIKNVPSRNISNLIKGTFLNDWDKYYSEKISIFVKSPLSELTAVNESEGDPELGIEIKYNELGRRVKADCIPYVLENTLFLDSCEAYKTRTERIPEVDDCGRQVINPSTGRPKVKVVQAIDDYREEVASVYRCDINCKIGDIINRLKIRLSEDALKIRDEVLKLLELEQKFKNAAAEEELIDVRAKIEEKRTSMVPRFCKNDVKEAIISKAIIEIHWRTIKKMNSLFGGYQMWHTDIYTQIMQVGRECFASVMKPVMIELREFLLDIRNEDARIITSGYINNLESIVKESTERIGQRYLNWALNEGFAPQSYENPFWNEVNDISGKGYKKRVQSSYEEHIYDFLGDLVRMVVNEVNNDISKLINMFPEY